VTNYRAAAAPSGRFDPSLNYETLLPGGTATILFRIPENTRRARLHIAYLRRAGLVGTLTAKILPVNSLIRWPKTLRWLNRHGLLGYFTDVYEGEWISNSPEPTAASFLFPEVLGDSLVPGFVVAQSPAAAAGRAVGSNQTRRGGV
jgi:hypothetical protein